jgi:hypothetical protein
LETIDDMAGNLTARKVQTAKPGKYSDGGNLYLIVSPSGSRKWVLRFTWRGSAKEMGLGSASVVPLADAREKAAAACRKLAQGLNPIEDRKRDKGIPTFGEMADSVRETLSAGFRNEKHKAQWKSTLETYAAQLRSKPVDTITTDDILAVLKPIWTLKPETPRGFVAVSRRSWMRPRPRVSVMARTQPAGVVTLTTCCPNHPSWNEATMRRCLTRTWLPSSAT